ncbi:glycosyltransferase family 77 protein [Aliiroseovarius sp. S1123]|uniref:putative nucleotide-diphospho-sugar transferase n=1 Tax=unclassified Aliiroseovarius TaxID=2623558 RepID=UPI001FF37DAF|nr:glycosyltransferase family 77 protein [Aliiroseovarius sp. S1123]
MTLVFPMTADDGFVFAATGAQYRGLAQRAARSLRAAMGDDIQIDLFADVAVDDPVFNQIHILDYVGTRPKMEALRESRFAHTVYLDCDVVAVADCSDMFALLRQFDCIGAHDQYGNATVPMHQPTLDLPAGFRQINSGVMGIRKSDKTQSFLRRWEQRIADEGERWDQPVLRELLWDSDLRVWILPPEYNLMHTSYVPAMSKAMAAPRLFHITSLHEAVGAAEKTDQPFEPDAFLGEEALTMLHDLLGRDRSLGAAPSVRDQIGALLRRYPKVEKRARSIWRRLR